MQTLFQNVLTAGLHGSIVILAVLLLRLVLKKVPKKYFCLLWLLAFLRLLMPFEIRFGLSLQPDVEKLSRPEITESVQQPLPEPVPAVPEDAVLPPDAEVVYGDAFTPPESIPEGMEGYYPSGEEEERHLVIDWNRILVSVWLMVAVGLVLYSLFSYGKLKRRVREAVRSRDGVWECAGLETAFILGWIKPRVYLPMGLTGDTRRHILRHERTHLKRRDHWLKLLAFGAVCVHWFNPLVWTAWVLLCRDMELACDEQVVKDMGLAERKEYSAALLRCSTARNRYMVCPVAFGEVSVKTRILSVLNYRRPGFWITLAGVVAVVFVVVFLMTSPGAEEPDLSFLNYENAISLVAEQEEIKAIYYIDNTINLVSVDGSDLAELLDTADWRERWMEPRDQSSPGSVEFIIEDDYRITVFDRRFARVKYGEEVRYYRISNSDYAQATALIMDIPEDVQVQTPSEEERALLLRCYDALAWHQVQGWKHTQVQISYQDDLEPRSDMIAEYWHSLDGSMRRLSVADGSQSDGWLVQKNGTVYCKGIKPYYPEDITSYTMWVEAVDPEPGVMTTWLEEYVWDFDKIRFLSSSETDEGTVVCFRVLETLTDNLGGTAAYHDVAFCLDEENHLVYATDACTVNGINEGESYTVREDALTRILSYDRDRVTEEMEAVLEDIQFPH